MGFTERDADRLQFAAKAAELQELVKRQIAPYKCPRVVEFLPELPHTPTGKLQRFKLRTLAAG